MTTDDMTSPWAGVPVLPPKELQARGYLQEANRLFFHPLGLAMGVMLHDDEGEKDYVVVLDGRDDPEGFVFGEDHDLAPMAEAVMDEQATRFKDRMDKLGFLFQPVKS